jgi:asparagine synthase (glutamine-hydrolysing)
MFENKAPARPSASLAARVLAAYQHGGIRGLIGRLTSRGRPATPEQRWIELHCSPLPARDPALHPDFVRALGGYSPEEAYLDQFRNAPSDDLLDKCLHHDLRCYLPSLLHMEDRTSMASSVESRVPLLDHRIAEFMARLPHRYRPEEPKGMLRAAARRWLPSEILERRDKAGFPLPIDQWLANELAGPVQRVLSSRASLDRGVFRPSALRGGELRLTRGWQALNLELWWRIFVEQDLDPATPLSEIE